MSPPAPDPGPATTSAGSPLPLALRVTNRLTRPLGRKLIRLEDHELVVRAMKRTALDDLGDDRISEPLGVLSRALDEEAHLHTFGRATARAQLVGLLSTRLRVADLIRRVPEITATPVVAPIIVIGMPRTGTTLLQRLIAQDPGLRSLPYWEAREPLPRKVDAARQDAPTADRIKRAVGSVKLLDRVAPEMKSMHELDPLGADEESWLLGVDLATMLFEATWHVPSFAEWYDSADLTRGYQWLRTVLQVLQWYRPGERWILRSPQHLEQLGPLLSVFPDATVVQTHRDPVRVVESFASMISYGRHIASDSVDPVTIRKYWSWRIGVMLRRSMEQRPPGDLRFIDVQFTDLMADPCATVGRIYEAADRELSDETLGLMRRWLAANLPGGHGAHGSRVSDQGLDDATVRRGFSDYTEHFGVAIERP